MSKDLATQALFADALAGRIDRRTVLARAAALGISAPIAGFLAQELARREELEYPPYRHLVSLIVSGPDSAAPLRALSELRDALATPGVRLLGPAPLLRLRGRHRAQLVAKTSSPRGLASRAAALLAAGAAAMRRDGLAAVVDVDPQSL